MEEYGESKEKDYPRGRGYGNDYMRGGEVFGGYGYQKRADYDRPRGDGKREQDTGGTAGDGEDAESDFAPLDPPDGKDSLEADGDDAGVRFPQDERAGGWDVPHDFVEDPDAPAREAVDPTDPTTPPRSKSEPGAASPATQSGTDAPEPIIEHTFGDTGGNRFHSRSYYVTQAQLQQRLYDREKE